MKKILKALTAFALSVVTVLGVVSIPATSAWASSTVSVVSFADVPGDAPFAKEISWLAAQEISTGWVQPDGSRLFKPLDAIGRDAMAAFLYRYAGKPSFTAPGTSPFTDVPTSYPFYKEITWLASRGITTGWDVGGGKKEFRPTASIGRDAMAAFLYRDAGKPSFTAPGTSPFTDVPTGYPFYKEITWLASSGVTTGYDDGGGSRSYHPTDPIARNAMAAFLYRYASSKEPANPSDPSGPTVTVAPDVKVLDNAALAGGSTSANSVTLPASAASKIRPGDVLAAGITTTTPDGLLARVTAVTKTPGGATVLNTTPATLADAIVTTNGPIEVPGVPVSSSFTPDSGDVTETAATTKQSRAEADATLYSKTFTWKKTYNVSAASSNEALTGEGTFTAKSTSTASATAHLTLDLGFLSVKEVSVVVSPKVTTTNTLTAAGKFKGQVSATLGSAWAAFTFWAGPVPIAVTADMKLAAGVTVDGTANVEVITKDTVASAHGFKYSSGSFSLINNAPTSTGHSASVKADASLNTKVSLDFDATVKLYGIAGVKFGAGPYAKATITVTSSNGNSSWTCPAELGIHTMIGVAAGISVLGVTLADWSKTTERDHVLYSANPCQGTAVTPPPPPGPTPTPTPTGAPTPTPTPTETPAPTGALKDITAVAGGDITGYALQDDGTVWSWGNGFWGQLGAGGETGNGNAKSSGVPVRVVGLSGVTAIAGGGSTGYALRGDGTVWAWGYNDHEQLGNWGSSPGHWSLASSLPVQIDGLSGVTAVAAGGSTGYALRGDGTVWAWGNGSKGQLGNGSSSDSPVPVQVAGLSGVTAITGGLQTGYAMRGDGTVWAWGSGENGELGNRNTANSAVPVQVANLSGVTNIAGGGLTGYALRGDGTVWAWGSGDEGQLGNGSVSSAKAPVQVAGLSGVTVVAGGAGNGYAVRGDGTVWAWGFGYYGLGNGSTASSAVPVRVAGVSGATAVAGGASTGYALQGDGTVWAWGWNGYGQVGNGTIGDDSPVPIPVRVGG